MQKKHISKTLAVEIFVLFIGVGIHPAFAMEEHYENNAGYAPARS